MTQYPAPADVAVTFIKAWGSQDMDAVAGLLAEDVTFESPRMKVHGAESALATLGEFSQVVTGIDVLAVLGDDRQAMIMYDMATGPFGTLRVVDHLAVENGKIKADSIVFDTYELRKAQEG